MFIFTKKLLQIHKSLKMKELLIKHLLNTKGTTKIHHKTNLRNNLKFVLINE